MDKDYKTRLKHFAELKCKYQATQYEDSSPSNLLYLILRKVDLDIELSELELNWLRKRKLFETIEIIELEKFKLGERKRLEIEFSQLKTKYKVSNNWDTSVTSFLYSILWKLEAGNNLTDSEFKLLQDNRLTQTVEIVQDMRRFAALKQKYKATKVQDSFPNSHLYKILNRLDTETSLTQSEYQWLLNHKLSETIEIFQQQESARQAKFTELKAKYQASQHPDKELSSQLYLILQKLDTDTKLIASEMHWLKKQKLTGTITIAEELEKKREFTALKVKYKATKYTDLSLNSDLYNLLKKIETHPQLNKSDIKYLRGINLTETIEFANQKYAFILNSRIESGGVLSDGEIDWLRNNKYEDIIILAQKKHFAILKKKYGLIDPALPMEPFYEIMLKIEKKERLDPVLVFQLIEEDLLSHDGKIARAYYRLEAEFYESEMKRTGNKWSIPNASSCWRKAKEPEEALKITNLDLNKIKDNKLKSAISVSRGAAFRDIYKLDDAEICAMQAIDYQPETHQPYTLMGAICYDRYAYDKGNVWFEKAIKLGAETEDIDAEIKRILKNAKNDDKRDEAAQYLLKKDAKRYAWAKDYLKKQNTQK
ncbi:hypothetical protein [Anabaena sp. CCY 0017]|uniref:hypothetical protein n=1 Tax=Anabaena sp. CCY 0017 TaxID=3103866 RepID=UPI0039C5FF2F